jgi:DNA-binding NarL/FixJ family response regulator
VVTVRHYGEIVKQVQLAGKLCPLALPLLTARASPIRERLLQGVPGVVIVHNDLIPNVCRYVVVGGYDQPSGIARALREANSQGDLSQPCAAASQYGQWRKLVAGSPGLLRESEMARKPLIRIAVIESDPLRLVGFRALFDSASGFELVSASIRDIDRLRTIDLALLSNCRAQNLFDLMISLKATRSDLRIIVTGPGDEETIFNAIVAGAKGYVDEAASPAEFVQAVRVVSQGSVWAPRRVLSLFIERVSSARAHISPTGRATFTDREKEVLELLIAGRSNKEIGSPLGIGERTVKAHVAKLMRKVGVQNRIALSVHALTHSLAIAK